MVTTGVFDGVHLGHKVIVSSLIAAAKNNNGVSLLVTFDPHPRFVLQENCDLKLINTLDEKIYLLEKSGIDYLLIIPFTKEFSNISSLEFVKDILVNQLKTKKLIIGYDHHFGKNREGSFEHLKQFGPIYGFDVQEIPVQDVNNINVSSTKIRMALEEGNLSLAKQLLGYSYFLSGEVVKGNQNGQKIGFPTANISLINEVKIIPKNGVYAVNVIAKGKEYQGMLNIGYRPTVLGNNLLSVEVNLFNFSENLYGDKIKVEFIKRIREEIKFESLESLKFQLQKDKEMCLGILNN